MIKWQDQHCGVIEATVSQFRDLMPDVFHEVLGSFPMDENVHDFWWDVRVSMLMPGQWPAIPNWHFDHIPRANGSRTDSRRDFKSVEKTKHLPMYMWLSGPPFTEFKDGRKVEAEQWVRFTQLDSHRAVAATEHCWRGFIRAVHKGIHDRHPEIPVLRRHSQVYLDAKTFNW